MARYFTKEDRYHCDRCDKWITEREMLPLTEMAVYTPGGHCPGCKVTTWCKFVTIGTDFIRGQEAAGRLMYMREPGENYG